MRPSVANTGVRTMPLTSGGTNARANRRAGAAVQSGTPLRAALRFMATSAIATATAASANHVIGQRIELSGGPEIAAVTIAEAPIATPPQPGTAVNSVARAIASRMKRRVSAAWAWIGSEVATLQNLITRSA